MDGDTVELPSSDRPFKTTGQTVWIDGDALVVKYSALYYGFLGQKRIPLENIKTVSWRDPGSLVAGFLEISVLGEAPPNPFASANVRHQNRFMFNRADIQLWRTLKSHLEQRASPSRAPEVSSTADEIRKLAELLKEGLLTRDEYEAQKGKLLER
jgi:hypothetical protein